GRAPRVTEWSRPRSSGGSAAHSHRCRAERVHGERRSRSVVRHAVAQEHSGAPRGDSFSARGLSQSAIVGSRAGPPMASGVADAFAALQFLAGHPRIVADRIGIVGFSFGGEMAHLTAFESLRAAMEAGARGSRGTWRPLR